MKATVVPAQVTTVEDKVAGNLGLSQLMLFATPVFGGSLLYAALPPSMGVAMYKLVILGIVTVISCILAIRIKGKIIASWLFVLLRYALRPKYYLFNKNALIYRREYAEPKTTEQKAEVVATKKPASTLPKLGLLESAELHAMLSNLAVNLTFETTKKGGLNVRLEKIQNESQ